MPPAVDPPQPPINMIQTRRDLVYSGQRSKSSVQKPVDVKTATAEKLLCRTIVKRSRSYLPAKNRLALIVTMAKERPNGPTDKEVANDPHFSINKLPPKLLEK